MIDLVLSCYVMRKYNLVPQYKPGRFIKGSIEIIDEIHGMQQVKLKVNEVKLAHMEIALQMDGQGSQRAWADGLSGHR